MSITHEEARRLIQFRADEVLKEFDHNLLEAHLRSCPECQSYEVNLNELESTLRPLMQRKWNRHPLPLSAGSTAFDGSIKSSQGIIFATRIIAMGLICIAFLFNIWQFNKSGEQASIPPSVDVNLIPTPSLQSTQTETTAQKCGSIQYVVQSSDTLESIAHQFSIPIEDINAANNIKDGALKPSMKLSIPVCNATPSGTEPNVRTTITPLLGSNTLTPVNIPTQ
jgi:LysM repeat protein